MQPGVIDMDGFIDILYDYELLFYICDCNSHLVIVTLELILCLVLCTIDSS